MLSTTYRPEASARLGDAADFANGYAQAGSPAAVFHVPGAFSLAQANPFAMAAMLAPIGAHAQTSFAIGFAMMNTGPLSHFDSHLAALYMQNSAAAESTSGFTSTVMQLAGAVSMGAGGKEYVCIDTTAKDGNGAALLQHLEHIGLVGGASFGSMASGWIAVDKLGSLMDVHDLGFASESAFRTSAGAVTTQAVRAEQTDVATSTYGVDGTGIRVGVISDSFNKAGLADNKASNIASGDLPNDTQVLQDHNGGTDEGRAMAQLIHDLASGASIDFATAEGGQANFAANILALAAAGDKVITDDVIYFAELAYQNGPIAQAVNQVAAAGVSYFSSAANDANKGLEQSWIAGAATTIGGVKETLMNFNSSGLDRLAVSFSGTIYFVLQWDQSGASAGNGSAGATSDVDLFITNFDGSTIYSSSTDKNIGHDPVEVAGIQGSGTVYVRIGLHKGVAPGEIKLMALGNGYTVNLTNTGNSVNDGTIYGHAAADGDIATGAASYVHTPAFGQSPPALETFSSTGFTRFWYDDAGNRYATPNDVAGPDVTAVDGGNTTFFHNNDFENDGHPNFFGTSAAAPDAAAVAALMLQANATLTPIDVENLLMDSAIDMDNPYTAGFDVGRDQATGAGLIQADKAVGFAQSLHIANPGAQTLYGTHLADTITGDGTANFIYGNAGNDTITGGVGADTLYGGADHDTFVFTAPWDSTTAASDLIGDLSNLDTIDLTGIDANETKKGDQAFKIVAAYDNNAGEAVIAYHTGDFYDGKTTISLYTNTDGIIDALILIQGDFHNFSHFHL